MKREDIDKLLGGYATGSLTPEEREALFGAALEDQSLFNQLAEEEPLRQLLSDPGARSHLLAALDAAPQPWYRRLAERMGRPGGMAAAAVAAALMIAATVYVQYEPWRERPALLTQLRRPDKPFEPPAVNQPEAAPVPLPPPPGLAPAPERKEIAEMAARAPAAPFPGGAGSGVMGGVIGGVPGGVPQGKLEIASRDQGNQTAGSSGQRPETAAAPALPPRTMAKAISPQPAGEAGAPNARALFDAPPAQLSFAAAEERADKRAAAPAAADAKERAKGAGPPAAQRSLARSASVVAPAAPVPHLGLRYAVLRRGPDGQFTAVDPSAVFTTAEPLRLLFEPNDAGYLYVLQREASGGWRQLFGESVQRRERVQVPSSGSLAYDEPGIKELYAVFTRAPEPAFANLQPGVLDQRLRGSLLLQKSADKALYIVNTNPVPQSQQVAFAITLSVRQP